MPTTNINLTIDKTTVGLGNVDNTSDASKPVSTAQQNALNAKEDLTNKATDFTTLNDTKYPTVKATNDRINALIAALVNSSPSTLDTLKELADALGDDPNFATTIANSLALKEVLVNKDTDSTFAANSDTKYPSQKAVKTAIDLKANLAPRIQTITSSATVTPVASTDDCITITAQAAALTIANQTGTPVNFQKLIIRIKDNGTARAITFGTNYIAMGIALPTTTVISKILLIGFIYDSVTSKWGCVAVNNEA